MIAALDQTVVKLVASVAHKSYFFDRIYMGIFRLPTFKMMPLVGCLWFMWFSKHENGQSRRLVITTGMAATLAMIVSRLVQNYAPKRPRPLHAEIPDYVAPFGVDNKILENWSSFPSDTSSLAVALATGVFFFSRPLGILCYIWTFFIICLPRIYGGYHYASDIMAGAVIGLVCFGVINSLKLVPQKAMPCVSFLEEKYTGIFYALAFFASYQIVTMFEDVRIVMDSMMEYLG